MTVKTTSESWKRGVRVIGADIEIGSSTGSYNVRIEVREAGHGMGMSETPDKSASIDLPMEQWKALVEDVAARLEKQQSSG